MRRCEEVMVFGVLLFSRALLLIHVFDVVFGSQASRPISDMWKAKKQAGVTTR